jgi:uncharacterized coiled-coil protein SlyX
MDHTTGTRLEKLEFNLAHLEHQFEQLNHVVIEQAALLKRLQTQQRKLGQTIETIELERVKATDSKPPHYQ